METEPTIRLTWLRDLMPLIGMLVAGLIWGMKLEGRYDRLDERITNISSRVSTLEVHVGEGVLPIARERINRLDDRVRALEQHVIDEHDTNGRHR